MTDGSLPSPPAEDPHLLWRELQRLRAAAAALRDSAQTLQRKLSRRDEELRTARAEAQAAERARVDAVRALEARTTVLHQQAEEARQAAAAARAGEARLRREYDRLRRRRVVRVALAAAEVARPLFQRWRAIRAGGRPALPRPMTVTTVPALPADQQLEERAHQLAALLRATLPAPPEGDGPPVTIVILNRSGAHHLRRLLPALEATAYRRYEVVVVDNASDDDSLALLDRYRNRLDLTVLRNDINRSFSEANNQGASAGRGDWVLLLNNDVEPLEAHWLSRLVATATATRAGAVGARLVYPPRPGLDNAGDAVHPDLTLQHRGIHFAHGPDGMPLPRNVGGGEDPLSSAAADRRPVPAATAACLLVRRDAWEAVGGLDGRYVYGTEDVDLCLRLQERGERVVYDGSAVLWHHEFGTQNVEGRHFKGANRRANRRAFVDRWGPSLYRQVLADRIRSQRWWSHEPLQLVTDAALPLEGSGWQVRQLPAADLADGTDGADVVVACDPASLSRLPPGAIRVGWLEAAADVDVWIAAEGFADLDLVVVATAEAQHTVHAHHGHEAHLRLDGVTVLAQLRDALLGWVRATRWSVLIATPNREEAAWWGDTHYAQAMQRELRARGAPARVALRPEEEAAHLSASDVVVHLLGLTPHRPRDGQVSVLWNISHPELMDAGRCEGYDLVLTAAPAVAADLAGRITAPVVELHQATDPRRFRPTPGGPVHELLFVANSRRARRPMVDALVPTSFDLAIYGREWFDDLVDPRHVRGPLVPNDELAAHYTAAAIVLNDHWDEMRSAGIISNRLYDALAAGAFVVSDHVDGLDEEFDGAVVTFQGRDELLAAIEHYLASPDLRREHAERGRKAVLARHTFAHRMETIAAHVDALVGDQPRWVVAPGRRPAPRPSAGSS